MNTNRTKFAAGLGSVAASTLLLLTVPTGPTQALHPRPPLPCVAINAGVYPVGAGFCPTTAGAIDWYKIARQLDAAASGAALINTAYQIAGPT